MKQRHKEEINKHNNKHNNKHKHILLISLAVLLSLLNINRDKKGKKKEQALKEADGAKKRAKAS